MLKNMARRLCQFDKNLPGLFRLNQSARFIHANAALLLFFFAAGVIAYGYDFFSFSLRIDSENHANYYGPQLAWVSQDRWGMYLLSALLLPDTVMPFIPTLVAVIGFVAGALFFVHALSEKRGLADYLAGAIAIACPVLYFAMYFTTLGYGLGIAFAVTSLGVYLLRSGTLLSSALASLCFTLGIGIYQAVLPLIATLFCLQLVSSIIHDGDVNVATFVRKLIILVTTVLIAAGLSQAISALMISWTQVPFDTAYLSQFIRFDTSASYFSHALKTTLHTGWDYYTGSKKYYLFDLLSLKVLFLFTLCISMYRLATASCSVSMRVIGMLLLLAAISAPLAMHLLHAGDMPPRTVLGISFVLAGLVFFTATAGSNIIRFVIAVLSISCFYNFSMINNRYAFSNQMTWEADRALSVQLLTKMHDAISKLPEKTDPYAQYPLEIVGWLEYQETPIFVHREVIGASFFTWGAGDPERVSRLFKTMGVTDYRPATKQEKLSVMETAQQMPSWPYKGSVDLVNNVVVVKLSSYNPNELLWLCEPPDNSHPACLKYLTK